MRLRSDLECAVRLSAEVSDLVRELAERHDRYPASLWIVTCGVRDAVSDLGVRQSCLWGLAGVIGAEQPQLWGGLLDVPEDGDIEEWASALSTVLPTPVKSIIALCRGELLAPGAGQLSGEPARKPFRCRPDSAYLITGGMGMLGLLMASWLAGPRRSPFGAGGAHPLAAEARLGLRVQRRLGA